MIHSLRKRFTSLAEASLGGELPPFSLGMGEWVRGLSYVEALGVVAAWSVGMTLVALAAGYGAQAHYTKRGMKVFDLPLKRGQTRTEIIGNVLFHWMWIPTAAWVLTSPAVHFRGGWWREVLTFFACVYGFQGFYWLLHRAMHWRSLFWVHRWHHQSLVTTPLTGFSIGPFEAVGWFVGFLGPAVLLSAVGLAGFWGYVAFLSFAWYGNIVGHANVEMMPAVTSTHWCSRLFSNPITYHCLHHARFERHYGFATAWMDALFGTQWEDWIAASKRTRSGEPLTSLREKVTE